MVVRFALYRVDDGEVFLMLPSPPDNPDFVDTGEVWHKGRLVAEGVKFGTRVGVWESSIGVELDEARRWQYDELTNTFIDAGPRR